MDKHREKLVDQYEEAALSLLMDKYADDEGAQLLRDFEASCEDSDLLKVPEMLDAKCQQLVMDCFTKAERKEKYRKALRRTAQAAILFFTLFGISTALILSVDALRTPALNFFMEISERYTSISFDPPSVSEDSYPTSFIDILDACIPAAYLKIEEHTEENGSVFVWYQNEEGHILSCTVLPSNGKLNIDTEDATQIQTKIYDHEAVFIDKDGYHMMWIDADAQVAFTLFADGLDLESFWELAYAIAD